MYYNFNDDVYDFVTLKDYKEFAEFVKSPENNWDYMFDDLGIWLRNYKPETYKKLKKEIDSKY